MKLSELDIELREKISAALKESSKSCKSFAVEYKPNLPEISGELPDWYVQHIDVANSKNSFPLALIENCIDPTDVFDSQDELVERILGFDGEDFAHYIDLISVDEYPDALIAFRINRIGMWDFECHFLGTFLSLQDLLDYCLDAFCGVFHQSGVSWNEQRIFEEYQKMWEIHYGK